MIRRVVHFASAVTVALGVLVVVVGGGAQVASACYNGCDPPTGVAIVAASGTTLGGTFVTITDTNNQFGSGPYAHSVFFGPSGSTVAAFDVQVINSSEITAYTPPGTAGPTTVWVCDLGGCGTATYTYVTGTCSGSPTVTGSAPNLGPAGTEVVITGTNLDIGFPTVSFGLDPAPNLTNVSNTSITAQAPPSVLSGGGTVLINVGADCESLLPTQTFTYPTQPENPNGVVTCTKVKGSIGIVPAMFDSGVNPEVLTLSATLKSCKTTGSTITKVSKGILESSVALPTNSCSGLATSLPSTATIQWTTPGHVVFPSTVTFSGDQPVVSPDVGFSFPGAGGTSSETGSFAGSDGGASSTASILLKETESQLVTACGSTLGLHSTVKIRSGSITVG